MFARRGRAPRGGRSLVLVGALVAACGSFRKGGLGGDDLGDATVGDGGDEAGDARGPPCSTEGESCQEGAGVCLGGICCDAEHACDAVCCPADDSCAFGACVVPGASCQRDRDCAAGEICDYDVLPTPSVDDAGVADAHDASDASDASDATDGADARDAGDASDTGDARDAGAGDVSDASDASVPLACKPHRDGHCIARPPTCGPSDPPPSSSATKCVGACPAALAKKLTPTLTRAWGGSLAAPYADDVELTPVVTQLDDDDCDGVVDERDRPDVVFVSFANGDVNNNGVLRAVTAVEGGFAEKWSVPIASGASILPWGALAAGDLDGVPGAEIVVCTSVAPQRVRVFGSDGKERFTSVPVGGCLTPSIADFDGDGTPEILIEGGILDGQKGTKFVPFTSSPSGGVVAVDLTGDGKLDVVGSAGVWTSAGARIADVTTVGIVGGALPPMSFLSVADLDRDGKPEVVAIDWSAHTLNVWQYDPAAPGGVKVVRRGVDVNGGFPSACPAASAGALHGGGSPTVARLDGDAFPDVAVGGAVAYAAFSGRALMDPAASAAETQLWAKPITNCAYGLAGSSAFDFDGDDRSEILFGGDEGTITVFRGYDGLTVWSTCASSIPLISYPFVADVDGDGHADIVSVASTRGACYDGTRQAGLRVFSQDGWPRARRMWNQYAYHTSNVGDEATIPRHEPTNWTTLGLNDDRRSSIAFANDAPDLVVAVSPRCTAGNYALIARVRNVGAAVLDVPVNVRFFTGTTLLGERHTVHALSPGASELVALELTPPPDAVAAGTAKVHAVIEDAIVPAHECRTDDNASPEVSGRCLTP